MHIVNSRRSVSDVVLIASIAVAIALGVLFRFYHLDQKVYSGDEVYTTLRMLGDTEDVLVARADGYHDARDLWLVLHPSPPQGATSPLGPVRALALEEPHHPPLYYVLGHLWMGVFGNSVAAIRALSATISLLQIPLAFWLGVELYGSRRAGWIAAVLVALSPVYVLYAQEAREYSLWTVVLLALGIAFLRAFRLDRAADWWLVAGLSAVGLYVYPFTGFVLLGFGAYALLTRWGRRGLLLRCTLAIAGAMVSFVPWLLELYARLHKVVRSLGPVMEEHLSFGQIARAFAGSLKLNVFDANLVHESKIGVVATGIAVLLFLSAIVFVFRRYPARISLFLLLPILASALPLLIGDVFGGQSVRNPRYFTPTILYLDFFLVGLLAAITALKNVRLAACGYALFVVLLAFRLDSMVVSSRAMTWWNKEQDNSIAVANAVNATERPVIVSEDFLLYSLALSNYLRPDVRFALRPKCYFCEYPLPKVDESVLPPGDFTDVFALGPSPQLQSILVSAIAARHLHVTYHCINVRHNCTSDLNVEPVFGTTSPRSVPPPQ
jgi:uncharacterized membrane protein